MFKKIKELLKKPETPAEGPTGVDYLRKLFPKALGSVLMAMANSKDLFEAAGINNDKRLRMFLAQMAHESAGFSALEEKRYRNTTFERKYGLGTAVGRVLGNTEPGDGEKYRGRGIIQLTGRWNYGHYGKKNKLDLLNYPDLAADPYYALRLALSYWDSKDINSLADKSNVKAVTRRINGGLNGLADRKKRYSAIPEEALFKKVFS